MPPEACAEPAEMPPAKLRIKIPRLPFGSAEDAWFWTMDALVSRRRGQAGGFIADAEDPARDSRACTPVERGCTPDDVLKCLDQLYRHRRIDLLHARVLRRWGERKTAPRPQRAHEKFDALIWREAIDRLEWPLRMRGIVQNPSEKSRNKGRPHAEDFR